MTLDPDVAAKLREHAAAIRRHTIERDRLIVQAHRAGVSPRVIGEAVGLSREGVRKIVLRATKETNDG